MNIQELKQELNNCLDKILDKIDKVKPEYHYEKIEGKTEGVQYMKVDKCCGSIPEPTRIPQIQMKSESLSAVVERLSKTVSVLENRLTPVIAVKPEDSCNKLETKAANLAPLAGLLDEKVETLNLINLRLEKLLREIEV